MKNVVEQFREQVQKSGVSHGRCAFGRGRAARPYVRPFLALGRRKTTLSRLLIERMPALKMSVSATTRPMRPGEVEGRDYLFVDKARFERMVRQNELLEWATVFDNRYGTPRAPVEAALSAGQDVLFDIDWQGTQQLREKARADVVSVFILPPSAADLEKRLHSRAQDSEAIIRSRMSRASHELSHWAEYDYIVVNRDVDEAFAEVRRF